MTLRTDEDIRSYIEPEAGAEVSHEVRAGVVVLARDEVAGIEVVVEANALRADSSLEFRRGAFPDRRQPDAVKIPENWAVGLIPA